jgi:hypothetical protein
MNILTLISDASAKWQRASPTKSDVLHQLVAQAGIKLPGDYLTFLLHSNGGEGELDIDPGWFQIWPAEEIVELNNGYETSKNAPGFFGFGGNGGGEMLAFDMRGNQPWPVVMLPYLGMEPEMARPVAKDFTEFIQHFGRANDNA